MPRDYEKKRAQMRAYYRTEAGQAASKRSKEAAAIRRGDPQNTLKIKPQALAKIISEWR